MRERERIFFSLLSSLNFHYLQEKGHFNTCFHCCYSLSVKKNTNSLRLALLCALIVKVIEDPCFYYCSDQTSWWKASLGGKCLFKRTFYSLYSITEERQGKNSRQKPGDKNSSRSYRGMLTGFFLMESSSCLITTHNHLFRALFTVVWALTH